MVWILLPFVVHSKTKTYLAKGLAKGLCNESSDCIFPINYAIPKSLKVSHWLSQKMLLAFKSDTRPRRCGRKRRACHLIPTRPSLGLSTPNGPWAFESTQVISDLVLYMKSIQ